VTAFTSNPSKANEAKRLGADHIVDSRQPEAIQALAATLDFILVTANVTLPWDAYLAALKPRGRLHFVGAVTEPIPVGVFSLLIGQKSVSASPLGSPATIRRMLEFAARHQIAPNVETMPFSQANEAFARLVTEKPAHRLVLVPG